MTEFPKSLQIVRTVEVNGVEGVVILFKEIEADNLLWLEIFDTFLSFATKHTKNNQTFLSPNQHNTTKNPYSRYKKHIIPSIYFLYIKWF